MNTEKTSTLPVQLSHILAYSTCYTLIWWYIVHVKKSQHRQSPHYLSCMQLSHRQGSSSQPGQLPCTFWFCRAMHNWIEDYTWSKLLSRNDCHTRKLQFKSVISAKVQPRVKTSVFFSFLLLTVSVNCWPPAGYFFHLFHYSSTSQENRLFGASTSGHFWMLSKKTL